MVQTRWSKLNLLQDWEANKGNIKGRMIMMAFRTAYLIRKLPTPIWFLGIPILILYRINIEWLLGVELPFKTMVGKGLMIQHGHALVVNDATIIGENCTLRNSCTLGVKINSAGIKSRAPILGNNVNVGANSVIIGPVTIGDNVVIGAGSVVVKDILPNLTVAGNPARVINIKS